MSFEHQKHFAYKRTFITLFMSSKEIYLSLYYLPPHLSRTGALRMLILFCILSPMRRAACKDKDSSKKIYFQINVITKICLFKTQLFLPVVTFGPLKSGFNRGRPNMPYWTPSHLQTFSQKDDECEFLTPMFDTSLFIVSQFLMSRWPNGFMAQAYFPITGYVFT